MAKKRLLWQLFASFLLIIVVSLLSITWYASKTVKGFYLDQTAKDLEARAHLATGQVLSRGSFQGGAPLNDLFKDLAGKTSTRYTLIAMDGIVVADSEEEPARMDNHGARPEIMDAMDGSTGVSIRFSFTLSRNMMYVAIPFEEAGVITGVLRCSIPLTAIERTMRGIYLQIALGGLVTALLAALASLILSRKISRPLEVMKQGAEHFARGDLDYRMESSVSLETSSLAEAMNQMAERLDERIRTVIKQRNEQEAVLSSMVEGVLAVDREERLINMNHAAAEMIGVDLADSSGRMIQEVIRNISLQAFVSKAMASKVPIEGDLLLGENRDRFVQANGTVLRGEAGEAIGVLIVLNDITRLKRLENIRRDFVANVSHELKTPITSIKGYVETLLDGALQNRDDAGRFLEIVSKHTNRLNAIIDDLLSLSRIEQGSDREEFHMEEGCVKGVLQAAIRDVEPNALARNIQIELHCDEDARVRMNAHLLEQAVVNLLDNAVKYSDEGGSVLVDGLVKPEGVVIRVRDQGRGIESEHLPRLFERFYRVDKARSRERGGTGLGLAIVKHIVQVHRGHVSVESTPGEGSCFTIHIPKT